MSFSFFFFQAEDGIRDSSVTGVQTCALPIWVPGPVCAGERRLGSQDQRHPGAGGLVGSGAVEDDVRSRGTSCWRASSSSIIRWSAPGMLVLTLAFLR